MTRRIAGRPAGAMFLAAAASLTLAVSGCGGSGGGKANAGSTAPPTTKPTPRPTPTYTAPPATWPVPVSGVTMSTGPAPWPPPVIVDNGKESAGYVAAAGLPYAEEMLRVHYHAHLDVIVNGRAVEVPPYIGFVAHDRTVDGLAPLHTHNPDGIIHIENSVPATFLLGQFFIEWGVRLTATCVGGYCADATHELGVFVNGTRVTGDPTKVVLAKHQEIAIEYGGKGQLPPPPHSYAFTSRE